ncbi:MAG: hypothetical protein KDN20_00840 [Verrucomicrobiae bacterium]|nr:hypothetical protein [Verrucomicrobiae bacterium]
MNQIFRNSLLLASLAFLPAAARGDDSKVLYTDLVQPILNAKCVACHGPDKQKGKLRLDSLAEIMKGSDGENVVPGKLEESLLTFRVTLPKDDDDVMPPEDETPLTKEEIEVLKFWVQSGAKGDAKIGDLKPTGEAANAIKVVFANPPKGAATAAAEKAAPIDPAKVKLAEETIGRVEKEGASLMAIAQDTPDLRFSALNVAKEYGDKNLELLKPVADQIKWMDLARTQVSDAGLMNLGGMKNLNRLHLENTKITDAGLDHLKGLANLEYLNLYGTAVTDAGIQKLAGLKNLKKLFIWQTKVTDDGAKKLAAALPGIDINTGWKEPAKPVEVAANTTPPPAPAKPATPAPTPAPAVKKPEPAKPATPTPAPAKPATPTPAPAKPVAATTPAKPATPTPAPVKPATPAPTPAPAKPVAAKPAPTPAPAPVKTPNAAPLAVGDIGAAIAKALGEANASSAEAKAIATSANTAAANAAKVATDAKTIASTAMTTAETATKASTAASGTSTTAAKTATDAKTVAEAAAKTATDAQKAATEAQKAAADAQKAAAAANQVANEAKALLQQLQKAAAAIAGATAK